MSGVATKPVIAKVGTGSSESTQIVLDCECPVTAVIPVLSACYNTLDMCLARRIIVRAHAYRTTLSDHIANLNFLLRPLENSASHTRGSATPPGCLPLVEHSKARPLVLQISLSMSSSGAWPPPTAPFAAMILEC